MLKLPIELKKIDSQGKALYLVFPLIVIVLSKYLSCSFEQN